MDILILITCFLCGYDEYFEFDNLPGGNEHCEYCSECGASLPEPNISGDFGVPGGERAPIRAGGEELRGCL